MAKGARTPGTFTRETATAAARKSVERRAELRELAQSAPDEYMVQFFEREKPALVKALMDAAFGRGPFENLPPDKRLSAVIKALEYAHGKPTAKAPAPVAQNGSQELEGLVIG